VRLRGISALPSPRGYRSRFILMCFRSPSEFTNPHPPKVCLRSPSTHLPGLHSPSRHQTAASTAIDHLRSLSHTGVPPPAPVRPRRFTRPRRFSPPRSLRVYFTPQPRPGFALQGFAPSTSRTSSSLAVALVSFAPASYRVATAPETTAHLQGFSLAEDPLLPDRRLACPTARSPLELHLPRVLLCEP